MKLLIFTFFITQVCFAKIPIDIKNTTKQVKGIELELNQKNQKIIKLKASINRIESNIETHNANYSALLSDIEVIQNHLSQTKKELVNDQINIRNNQKELKNLLSEVILNQSNSFDFVIKKKIIKREIKELQKELARLNLKEKKISILIESYSTKLSSTKAKSEILRSLITDLENNKEGLAKTFIKMRTQRGGLEKELTTAKVKLINQNKKVSGLNKATFKHPINTYESFNKSSKGVTYKFRGEQPIYAAKSGKIVYLGELASYVQVIMVDHGNSIRSVLLGNLAFKIGMGDEVKKGSLLAYTRGSSLETNNLYFEIRKKNIAQNTSKWIN